MKIDEIEESISDNLEKILWIDCFSRKVLINILALDEVTKMIENNINEYRDMNIRNDSENFAYKINSVILDMIENYYSQDGINDEETSEFLRKRFYNGSKDLLPIPVVSSTSPSNAQHFFNSYYTVFRKVRDRNRCITSSIDMRLLTRS